MPEHVLVRHAHVQAGDYRTWKLVHDNTLSDMQNNAELVSPPLTYGQMPDARAAVAALRAAGARADRSTSVHIHLDASALSVAHLSQLVRLAAHYEPLIYRMLGVQPERQRRFCAPVRAGLLESLEQHPPRDMHALEQAWFKPFFDTAGSSEPEALTRRRARSSGINLNPLFGENHTVELRYFEGTLNPDRVHHFVDFAHALLAASQQPAAPLPQAPPQLGEFLQRLGLTAPHFAAAEQHFTKVHALQDWVDQAPLEQREARREAARVVADEET